MLGVPKPSGASHADGYGFEINVDKVGGGRGYADAWKRGCFAWEYKSPGSNLGDALRQLKLYASDLENPPLLIVSDMRRIEIHTNWTSQVESTFSNSKTLPTPVCVRKSNGRSAKTPSNS